MSTLTDWTRQWFSWPPPAAGPATLSEGGRGYRKRMDGCTIFIIKDERNVLFQNRGLKAFEDQLTLLNQMDKSQLRKLACLSLSIQLETTVILI